VASYLDSVGVIYAVENHPVYGPRAIQAITQAGSPLVVSDLTVHECLVGPLTANDGVLLLAYQVFFADPRVRTAPLTAAVYLRAAHLRAQYRFLRRRTADAIHLAGALEAGCTTFLTNDQALLAFPLLNVQLI
jgi:predicted nucleic acid-binding protein